MALQNPFLFSTKFYDSEIGLVYYGYRCYDPTIGRWLNQDPAAERDVKPSYLFCRNQSVNRFDRSGLDDVNGVVVSITPIPTEGDKAEEEASAALKKWMDRGLGLGFTVNSITDANTKLQTCTNCIKELNIQGHGALGIRTSAVNAVLCQIFLIRIRKPPQGDSEFLTFLTPIPKLPLVLVCSAM